MGNKKKKKKKVLEPNLAGPTRSDKTIFYLLPFISWLQRQLPSPNPETSRFFPSPFFPAKHSTPAARQQVVFF
jgi:hypothetical protein